MDQAADGSSFFPVFPPKVLVVDDDASMLGMLKRVLSKKCGCKVEVAGTAHDALQIVEEEAPDLIVSDVKMPGLDGMEFLRIVKQRDPAVSVILMSGYGTIEIAVQAVKEGAYDFLAKPFDNDQIVRTVMRALERTRLLRENRRLHERVEGEPQFFGIVGNSPCIRGVMSLIRKIADTDVTVLIRGESGTGKELAARAIHALSSRSTKRMVTVNCPALPEEILESELFGYVKGAFTGATRDKRGLFLEADGSTILLDEIGDMPVSLQTKLLRVIQEKEIRPLGSTRNIRVDVRVLASTNQDLEEKIRQGLFREDLFFRLNVVTIVMPTLGERPEDIESLARHFLKTFAQEYERSPLTIDPDALSCLVRRRWPGNVRELENVIKRAVLLTPDRVVTKEHLFLSGEASNDNGSGGPNVCFGELGYNEAKEKVVASFSRAYLTRALQKTGGNVTSAARMSGIERQAFQRLMRRYGVLSGEFRDGRAESQDEPIQGA